LHFIPYFFLPFAIAVAIAVAVAVAVVVRLLFANLAAAASRLVAGMLVVGGHGRKAQAFNLEDTPTNYNKCI
jgi:hypothetical protein